MGFLGGVDVLAQKLRDMQDNGQLPAGHTDAQDTPPTPQDGFVGASASPAQADAGLPPQAPQTQFSAQTSLPPRPGAIKGLLTNYLDTMSKQLQQQNQPQGFLGGFRSRMHEGADVASGVGDLRLQRNQQIANAIQLQQNAEYKDLQGQQYQPMSLPFDLQDGQGNVIVPRGTQLPANLMEKLISNQNVQATKKQIAADQIASREKIEGLRDGLPVPVPSEIAEEVGMPEIAGKPLGKSGWDNINKRLSAQGKNLAITDIGADRVLINKSNGQVIKRLGAAPGLVAGVARAATFAKARAAYTPVEFQDPDTGEMRTGSALEALNSGQAIVSRPNGERILSRTAVMNDIEASLGQLKEKTFVLNGGNRAKIAAALADPNGTPTKFLQSEIASSLSPDEQDYVIQNLNAREQIYGLRKALTGAAGGSDQQAAAILKTLPSASTPSKEYADKQIDTSLGVLGRLRKGIQSLPKPKQAPTSGGAVVDFSSLPKRKK